MSNFQLEHSVAGKVPSHCEPRRCDRLPWLSRARVGRNQVTRSLLDRQTHFRPFKASKQAVSSIARLDQASFRAASNSDCASGILLVRISDLPSQQRAMSDLGAPGGTRPNPNAFEHHARARTMRDPAAPGPVSSRTRPSRAKAGARAFPETTTDITSPPSPPSARQAPPRTARRAPSRTFHYDRAAFPGTVRLTRVA